MTDTISILSKPRIKCYVGNNKLYSLLLNTAINYDTNIEKLTEEWLWTGESTHCVCNHHVEQHCTIHDRYNYVTDIHCHGGKELCNCKLFTTRSMRITIWRGH